MDALLEPIVLVTVTPYVVLPAVAVSVVVLKEYDAAVALLIVLPALVQTYV